MSRLSRFTLSALALNISYCLTAQAAANADAAPVLTHVEVIGSAVKLRAAPGSGAIVDAEALDRMRPSSINEVLRSVPGVVMRDEEGFGLRPNIGIRGLNPTRSTKVLLLEDGLPAAYAPYGDNASYYHAPIDRYERVEVLKGVGMLRFGPQTIGGVINYITPEPTQEQSGFIALTAGNRGYANAHARLNGAGALFDLVHKQGDGARDTLELLQTDLNFKYSGTLADDQAITARLNYLREDSQVGYSGLTEAELRNFGPDYGFDQNANFDIERFGGSLTHAWYFSEATTLSTNVYAFRFDRDWWRQSSTSTDTQCGTAFRDARLRGERVNFDGCNSAQGRLRLYKTYGIEPRLSTQWQGLGANSELELGLRIHDESQERRQLNANTARGRDGMRVENNRRTTRAYSGFISNTFDFGALAVVPVVRVESIEFGRLNRLTNRAGEESLTTFIPGLGINYQSSEHLAFFGGAHRGFAPPRAEDIIDNNGGSVDLDAEDSRNIELGLRGDASGLTYEVALFRNHFLRQISVGSIAGGNTPLAEGETLYQGAELMIGLNKQDWFGLNTGQSYLNVALTLLPTARQESPLRAVIGGAPLVGSGAGKRLPYAPKTALTVRVGQHFNARWDASIEGVYVGQQFGDFANRTDADASGQFGLIKAYAIANATVNYTPLDSAWSGFFTVKNIFDRRYIIDRTRGIQIAPPRQVQLGLRLEY